MFVTLCHFDGRFFENSIYADSVNERSIDRHRDGYHYHTSEKEGGKHLYDMDLIIPVDDK